MRVPEPLVRMLSGLSVEADGRFWPVHRTTAWRWVRGVMLQVGIVGPMACCRGCRHGFGMRAAASNVPPNLIQRWLGHASPATTAVYLDAVGLEEREFASRMWDMPSPKRKSPAGVEVRGCDRVSIDKNVPPGARGVPGG